MPSISTALLAGLLAAGNVSTVLTVHDPAIDEASGLTRSVRHPGVLWMHNDGGSFADIYGVDDRGHTVARLRLRGIDPYDPEAMAPGVDPHGRPALLLGDIGDNREQRPDVSVFRVTEPKRLGERTVDATWFRFTYEDGPHDAEALLVDPRDGRIWVATKSFGPGGLYRGPRTLVEESAGTNVLRRVADVPPLVTDGAFLPDGRFVLRTYTAGYVYDRPGSLRDQVVLPIQQQGESVAVDGDRLLLGSEGLHSQVLAVPLPADVAQPTSGPAASPGSRGSPDSPADRAGRLGRDSRATWALAGGAVVLLGLVVATRLRRRRR